MKMISHYWERFLSVLKTTGFEEDIPALTVKAPPIVFATAKPMRKKADTTKITQYMYDFVIWAYAQFKAYNAAQLPGHKMTTVELTNAINLKMKLNKSPPCYSKIWRLKVDRKTLAVGEAYFQYKGTNNEIFGSNAVQQNRRKGSGNSVSKDAE